MTCAIYRQYDAAGTLLYVGISRSLIGRQSQHMRGSAWAREIARIDIEWLGSESDALNAEAEAIEAEGPKYNIKRPGKSPVETGQCAWRERLSGAVIESGMSMRAVSVSAGLGAGYVHSILVDGKEPTVTNMVSICTVLCLPVEKVLGGAA